MGEHVKSSKLYESQTELPFQKKTRKTRRPSSAPAGRSGSGGSNSSSSSRASSQKKREKTRPQSASQARRKRRPSKAKKPTDNQMWNDRTTILNFEKRAQNRVRPSSAKLSSAQASKYLLKQKINLGSPRSMNRCRHGLRVAHSSQSPFTSMQHRSAALGLHQRLRTPVRKLWSLPIDTPDSDAVVERIRPSSPWKPQCTLERTNESDIVAVTPGKRIVFSETKKMPKFAFGAKPKLAVVKEKMTTRKMKRKWRDG